MYVYAILVWGSTHKTWIQKVQTKQNHATTIIYFLQELSLIKTDNVVPLINLLELLNTEALAKITKTRKTLLALTRVVWSQA